MKRTISEKIYSSGYLITFKKTRNKRNHLIYRFLIGRVLTQTQNNKKYITYYPGYLHNIPFVFFRNKAKMFISNMYDLEPILKIIKKYDGDGSFEFIEKMSIFPQDYLTGFQRTYIHYFKKNQEKQIDWSRGLNPELVRKYTEIN
jgi:hypothetical protein